MLRLSQKCINRNGPELVLIAFCNQSSSPLHSLISVDLSGSGARWIDLSCIPEAGGLRESFAGVCGVCWVGDQVVIATQGARPILAIVDIEEAKIGAFVPLEKCKDTHSIVFHCGYVYAVSTGTNEVYRVALRDQEFGVEELYWQYPGVRYDRDEIHLNGIAIDGDRFIASCFGEREEEGGWGSNGKVFYLDTAESIRDGLMHPHTPLVVGDQLFFAESAARKVYVYHRRSRGTWALKKGLQLSAYTRGLMFRDGRLLVGLSASRKISRSKGTLNENVSSSSAAALVVIDPETGRQEDILDLESYGREIYDVITIMKSCELSSWRDAMASRIRELEATVDRYVADTGRLWLENRGLHETIEDKVYELGKMRGCLEGEEAPRVSVIIPTYNRAAFIGDAVRSVLAQTYFNLEVIVVDDGSTDNTKEVLEAIEDPRIVYLYQENKGRSVARNRALRMARGQYISFLDSDDLYLPQKIELQVGYLDAHPKVGMIYTSAYCIDSDGNMLDHKYEASASGRIYEDIAFFTPVTITLPTVMARREVFNNVGGFDENMHRFEDTDMWRRISKSYWIDAIPEYTCKLRTHGDNALVAQNPEHIVAALRYYSGKINREDAEISRFVRRKGLARLYGYYGRAMMTVPQWRNNGRKLLWISFWYWPFLQVCFSWLVSPLRYLIRFVYYRSLNRAYALYSRLRRWSRNLLGSIGRGNG